jgi:hypothetical protein
VLGHLACGLVATMRLAFAAAHLTRRLVLALGATRRLRLPMLFFFPLTLLRLFSAVWHELSPVLKAGPFE